MKRTEIIKALECCTSGNSVSACMSGCPLYEKEDCECINDDTALLKYALSLIKELTAENERLKNSITFQVVMPNEKMEEIKAECIARVELDVKKCRADTVRKYRECLYRELASLGAKDKFNKEFFLTKVDQIAKEMLNDGCEM